MTMDEKGITYKHLQNVGKPRQNAARCINRSWSGQFVVAKGYPNQLEARVEATPEMCPAATTLGRPLRSAWHPRSARHERSRTEILEK